MARERRIFLGFKPNLLNLAMEELPETAREFASRLGPAEGCEQATQSGRPMSDSNRWTSPSQGGA